MMNGQKKKEFLSSLDLQTPTGNKDQNVTTNNDEEEQLEIEDDSQSKSPGHSSGSSSGDQIGSDDSEDDDEPIKAEAKKGDEETHEDMRNFAE